MSSMRAAPVAPSIEELLYILFKRKWSILAIIFLTVLCTSFWVFFLRDDLYMTEAKILVKEGQEDAPPSTLIGQQANSVGYRSANVKSEADILQSTELLSQIVDKYHLDVQHPQPRPTKLIALVKFEVKTFVAAIRNSIDEVLISAGLRDRLTAREKALAMLEKGLSVKAVEGSNTIVADLFLPTRQNSAALLNALLDDYQQFRLALYRDRGNEFFLSEMRKRADALAKAEEERNSFETKSKITNQPTQKNLFLEQLNDLELTRQKTLVEFREAQYKVDRLNDERRKPNPNFGALGGFDNSPFVRDLLTEITKVERHRQEMLLTEMENSDKIANVTAQAQTLQNTLSANLNSVLNEKRARYEAAVAEYTRVNNNLTGLHGSEVRWLDLSRRVAQLEEEYHYFRKKYEESSASRTALEQQISGNIVITQRAIDPLEPAGTRKTTYVALSILAGLMMALAYVSVLEFFDERVYTSTQLERTLEIPVVSAIPRYKSGVLPG